MELFPRWGWFSYSGARIGGQVDAIPGDWTARSRRCLHGSRVIMHARPFPIFRSRHPSRLHRVEVNLLHLLVVLPHRAQSAVEEPALEKHPAFPALAIDAQRRAHL